MNKLFSLLLLVCLAQICAAQQRKSPNVCSKAALALVHQLPKLEYDCPEGLTDYDDKILKLPDRLAAIRGVVKELEGFAEPAWWRVSVDELTACEVHGAAGKLTDEEKSQWRNGEYSFTLFGNNEMRLALIADPCYQTGYGGANGFLLYRKNGRVVVTQVLNGYFSRVDNSVGVNFAKLKGQQIIEVMTSNSMPPSLVSYFFAIDNNGRANPLKIFPQGRNFTNEIYSMMLMGEPKDFGLPASAAELNIIRNGTLAPSFSAYEESERGKIDANGRNLRRLIYRWNGRFYSRSR